MNIVYRFLDFDGKVIYIGKTKNLSKRVFTHFSKKGHLPDECYLSCCKIEYMEFESATDMDLAEIYLINKYSPIYNKMSNNKDYCTWDLEVNEDWKDYEYNIQLSKFRFIKYKEDICNELINEIELLKDQQKSINSKIEYLEREFISKLKSKMPKDLELELRKENNVSIEFIEVLNKILIMIETLEPNIYFKHINKNTVAFDLKTVWDDISEGFDRNTFLKLCKKFKIFRGISSEYYKSIRFKEKLTKAYLIDLESLKKILREAL